MTARTGENPTQARLSDRQLTAFGLPPRAGAARGRVLVIGCGALAREILAIVRANGLNHVDVTCLPAILHNRPERIVPALRRALETQRAGYDAVFVAYADCGTGGALRRFCEDAGIEMIAGPHCYAFYEGNAAFAGRKDEIDAFYLTDFLVRQFEAFVWKPLGLDRHPELRESYFGHYRKLVYQAQSDDPALARMARDHARRLGLSYERRLTGYGDLEGTLLRWAERGREPG